VTKNEEKKRSRLLLQWIAATVGIGLISFVLGSFLSKADPFESTKRTTDFLLGIDIGLLLLVLVLFISVYSLNRKNVRLSARLNDELSDKNIAEILENNKNFTKLLNELKDKANRQIKINETFITENKELNALKTSLENLKPRNEVRFILKTLANQATKTDTLKNLEALYTEKFEKQMSDLQIILSELDDLQLIEEGEMDEYGQIRYSIRNKGLRYLKQSRM